MTGAVYDRGYRAYEGERGGRGAARPSAQEPEGSDQRGGEEERELPRGGRVGQR